MMTCRPADSLVSKGPAAMWDPAELDSRQGVGYWDEAVASDLHTMAVNCMAADPKQRQSRHLCSVQWA
eukprot:scaffold375654_cov21-Prasinocladus_malaysianus.AAC.1